MAEGAHDVIILSNFGFIIFSGFRSTGGQNFHLPIDFAGHRYNSAAATVQPVIVVACSSSAHLSVLRGLLTWEQKVKVLAAGEGIHH